jgi:succinoglycan biosynthesis transport protein ExoP
MRKANGPAKSESSKFHLGEYWRILWRKKYLVLLPLVLPVVVSAIGVQFLVPVYESGSIIRMEDNQVMAKDMERYVQLQDRRRMHDREALERIEADLKINSFLDQLITRLGMDQNPQLVRWAQTRRGPGFPDLTPTELIHRRLRSYLVKKMKVENAGPGMFKISCSDFDPEASYVLADGVTNLFIELQEKKELEGLQQVSDFSDEQLAVYKDRLDKSERDLEQFKRMMNQKIIEANPVGENNIRYAETISKQIEIDVENEQNVVSRIRENLVALFGVAPSKDRLGRDGGYEKLRSRLIAQQETHLLLQLAGGGLGQTTEEKNAADDVDSTEKDLQRYISNFVQSAFRDSYQDYHSLVVEYFFQQTVLESQTAKRSDLASYIDSYRRKVSVAPQQDRELKRLTDAVETNRALYQSFLNTKTSTQISESVKNTGLGVAIEVVERATRPLSPVRPNKPKIIVLALLFGGFLGVASLVVSEYSDTSFRSVEDVEEHLELRVLGTIPKFDSTNPIGDDGGRKKLIVWASALAVIAIVALFGFYYYGKTVENEKLDLYRSTEMRR